MDRVMNEAVFASLVLACYGGLIFWIWRGHYRRQSVAAGVAEWRTDAKTGKKLFVYKDVPDVDNEA